MKKGDFEQGFLKGYEACLKEFLQKAQKMEKSLFKKYSYKTIIKQRKEVKK